MLMTRIATAALAVGAAACMTIQPVRQPAQFIQTKKPQLLWVTNSDGEVMTLSNAHVDGDQVVGMWEGIHEEVKVPFSQARLVEARQVSPLKTAVLGGTLVASAGVLTYWIINATAPATLCQNPEPGGGNQCNAGDPTKGR